MKPLHLYNRGVEREYRRKLRKIAGHVGDLVGAYSPDELITDPDTLDRVTRMLNGYGGTLQDWAEAVAHKMVEDAARRNLEFWKSTSVDMSKGMRELLEGPEMLGAKQALMRDQIELITSLPTDAAARVHTLTQEAKIQGHRADAVSDEIMRSGDVTKARADLIARTEVQRTSSTIVEERAGLVGSEEYIWRTAGDSDVRHGHRAVADKTFRWDDPPGINEGTKEKPRIMHHHPGRIWNCRCYPEPIIPG